MPQGNVLEARLCVCAQQTRQPADALADDRVPLVGHRRRSLLTFGEWLLGLTDLGALKVPYLLREPFERRPGDGKRGEELGMAVARGDLRGRILDTQAETIADVALDLGLELRVSPDRSRDLADRDRIASS